MCPRRSTRGAGPARAHRAGQSLQQFLAAQLAMIAATPTIDDMLEQIESRPKRSALGRERRSKRSTTSVLCVDASVLAPPWSLKLGS